MPDPLPRPDYERGVHRLVPEAVAAIRGEPGHSLPLAGRPRAVAVLVIDGLGERQLARHADLAPTLAAAPREVRHAPFPTTTATSLAGIGTGLPPGEHGITGYSFVVPGDHRPLLALTWSWEVHDPALAVTDEVVPEQVQPVPTAFETATASGVRPVTVLRPEFVTSGLTRAVLRGGEIRHATGLDETCETLLDAVSDPGSSVVYAHHGDLDTLGHLTGPGSEEWQGELRAVDAALDRLRSRLPDDVAVVVTADHGMVHVPDEGLVELADHPVLLDGVATLTGDARARQLHTEPGAGEHVLAAWRDHAGEAAHVLSRREAVEAGWFGPRVGSAVSSRIGDVVVCASAPDVAWVHRDVDLLGGRLPGMHGALTSEELEVPAAVLTRDAGSAP